jgi:hypothetical protein
MLLHDEIVRLFLVSIMALLSLTAIIGEGASDLADLCNQKTNGENNTRSMLTHEFNTAPLVIYYKTSSSADSASKSRLNDSEVKYCRLSVISKNASSLLIVRFELNAKLCDNVTVLVDVGYYSTTDSNDTSIRLLNQSNICDLYKTSGSFVIVEKPINQLEINLVDYSRINLKSAPIGLFGSLISAIVITAYNKASANGSKIHI